MVINTVYIQKTTRQSLQFFLILFQDRKHENFAAVFFTRFLQNLHEFWFVLESETEEGHNHVLHSSVFQSIRCKLKWLNSFHSIPKKGESCQIRFLLFIDYPLLYGACIGLVLADSITPPHSQDLILIESRNLTGVNCMKLNFEPFYQELIDTLGAYQLATCTIYTDQSTIAPRKGCNRSNEALAILGSLAFELEHDPEMYEKIKAYQASLPEGSLERKEVDLRLLDLEETKDVPADFFRQARKNQADAEVNWVEAKNNSDYEMFKPYLKQVVEDVLKTVSYSPRYNGSNAYDLLLDTYEKGMQQKEYDEFFDVIKTELIPLIAKVNAAEQLDTSLVDADYDIDKQREFSKALLKHLKVDPGRVYLSETEHPFTNFHSHDDSRITTHYYKDNFLGAALSTVHEYGHALYSLQMDPAFDKTKLADAVGCAAHESQSRFLENHIGRSKAFWTLLYPDLVDVFPAFKDVPVDELVAQINVSRPTLVRTEADELTYPMHILIRYEIEKMMADGTLDYDKLPEIWADKYEQYLGIRPESDKEGVLQDMHWSGGSIGYFPSYALGSAYAAQLYEKMAEEIDVEKALEEDRFEEIQNWLEKNVHHYGASKTMREIVEEVSGKPFDPHIYTNYLKDKYTKLYHLD